MPNDFNECTAELLSQRIIKSREREAHSDVRGTQNFKQIGSAKKHPMSYPWNVHNNVYWKLEKRRVGSSE